MIHAHFVFWLETFFLNALRSLQEFAGFVSPRMQILATSLAHKHNSVIFLL
jgi:hypothetical protein